MVGLGKVRLGKVSTFIPLSPKKAYLVRCGLVGIVKVWRGVVGSGLARFGLIFVNIHLNIQNAFIKKLFGWVRRGVVW